MWDSSMVQKDRLLDSPSRDPTKTNISMREMPVMMSGLIMGMLVTVSMAARTYLLRSLWMPTAAAVPITVAMTAEEQARMRVFFSDRRVSPSRKSSRYHFREKPEKTERLLASLKEKTRRMMMGAKRKRKMSAV